MPRSLEVAKRILTSPLEALHKEIVLPNAYWRSLCSELTERRGGHNDHPGSQRADEFILCLEDSYDPSEAYPYRSLEQLAAIVEDPASIGIDPKTLSIMWQIRDCGHIETRTVSCSYIELTE